VYIDELSDHLKGDMRPLPRRFAGSLRSEAGVLVGGLPTVVVYVLCALAGASPSVAGYTALAVLVLLLCGTGFLGARRAGLSRGMVVVEALAAGCLGVLIIGMKALLH
jgi:hypothetical protein